MTVMLWQPAIYLKKQFAVKNVVSSPKLVAFFAIRWYTIFAV